MKRIQRNRRLTPGEAAKYKKIRFQVADELPELVARHHDRMAALDQLEKLCAELKAAREAKGLSLADVTELTGMDRSALSKLETGQRKPHCRNPRPLRRSRRQTPRRHPHRCLRVILRRPWEWAPRDLLILFAPCFLPLSDRVLIGMLRRQSFE